MSYVIFGVFSLFWRNKSRLMPTWRCLPVFPPYQLLNGWTSLYEIYYAYYGTWAHLNGVLHKSLPSVSMYIYIIVARQRLGKNVTSATNIHATRSFLCGTYRIKECRQFFPELLVHLYVCHKTPTQLGPLPEDGNRSSFRNVVFFIVN
jgi:hypothetical protein